MRISKIVIVLKHIIYTIYIVYFILYSNFSNKMEIASNFQYASLTVTSGTAFIIIRPCMEYVKYSITYYIIYARVLYMTTIARDFYHLFEI